MEKDKILEYFVFQSYWLSYANPDTVFEWLRKQKPVYEYSPKIQQVLIERREPLINLGLALYAKLTSDTALRLFRNGDTTVQMAVLAGPSVGVDFGNRHRNPFPSLRPWIDKSGILRELLQSFDDNIELLGFLFSNESIPIYLLTSLYERTDPFNELTDEQWIRAIELTISNPAVSNSTYRNTSIFRDKTMPMPRYGAEDVFDAAWKLFNTVPVNEDSARILSCLGEILAPNGAWLIPSAPSNMDVLATKNRWNAESNDGYGYFRRCRAALGRLLEDEKLKDSDDIALRQAYYADNLWNSCKPEEVREAFEKDKDKFLEVAIENLSFYRYKDVRDELRQCCHDYAFKDEYLEPDGGSSGDIYSLNRFDVQSDLLERKHPELFPDSQGDIRFHEVSDLSLRAEKRLVFLQKQIKVISQELIGAKSKDDDAFWHDEEKGSLIDNMKAALDQSNQLILSKVASVTAWAVFVGILFAIILIVILIKL